MGYLCDIGRLPHYHDDGFAALGSRGRRYKIVSGPGNRLYILRWPRINWEISVINPIKRKLSAKQILADIRSGMDGRGLKRKYLLSDKALESVYTQLAAKGALTENEIRRLRPLPGSSEVSPEILERPRWRCPACNTPQAAEMPECPVCGVVVEKFVARQDQADPVLSTAAGDSPDTGPSERTGWMPIIISIVVFAIAGSCLLLWSTHKSKEAPVISEVDAGAQSPQLAATEADQTQEDTRRPGKH